MVDPSVSRRCTSTVPLSPNPTATIRGVGSAPKSSVFFSNSIGIHRLRRFTQIQNNSPFTSILSLAGRGRRQVPVRSKNKSAAICEICGYKSAMKIRWFLISSLSLWLAPLLSAQQTPQSLADAELPSLLTIYKDIHTHPELSGYEERTAALVAKELRAAGCQVTEHVGKYENSQLKGYGVVGVMKNGDGPTVLVRTDMDA